MFNLCLSGPATHFFPQPYVINIANGILAPDWLGRDVVKVRADDMSNESTHYFSVWAVAAPSAFPLVLTDRAGGPSRLCLMHSWVALTPQILCSGLKIQLIAFLLSAAIWLCGNWPKRKQEKKKKKPRNKTTNRWNWFIFGIKRWG